MARMINDRKPDMGSGGKKHGIFPDEVHVKHMNSAEGAGKLMDYPDTEEKILRDQNEGIRKAESRKMKAGYRN